VRLLPIGFASAAVVAAMATPLALAGCGSESPRGQKTARETGGAAKATAQKESPRRQDVSAKDFDPNNFADSTNIETSGSP